jgi:uncharacterized repeat protein (TIGR03809 family)
MVQATTKMERVALKWRELAERRRAHFIELYRSGRWKNYYSDDEFLAEMRAADALARHWAKIAPLPEERDPPAEAKAEPSAEVVRLQRARAA